MKRFFRIGIIAIASLAAGLFLFTRFYPQPACDGKPLRAWIDEVIRPSGHLSQAIAALQKIGPDAVPPLVELLHRQDSSLRGLYAKVLIKLPAKLGGTLPSANLDSAGIRARAAAVLGKLGSSGEAAAPNLIEALKDPERTVRMAAATSLGSVGRDAWPIVVPALLSALNDCEDDVRLTACSALGQIGPEAQQAVPALIKIIQIADANLQTHAVIALGKIGPAASSAVPDLLQLLSANQTNLRLHANQALSQIDPQQAATVEPSKSPDARDQ